MEIYKEFQIEVAHRLPNVPSGHNCHRLHGHSFRVRNYVAGSLNDKRGWVMDFGDISAAFAPLHTMRDRNYLNEIAGLENPPTENLCRWIWTRLSSTLKGLAKKRGKRRAHQSVHTASG